MYNQIAKKESKQNVCKWWPCNGRREHLEILFDYGKNSLIMEETLHNKGILEKGKGKGLVFYPTANKLKP